MNARIVMVLAAVALLGGCSGGQSTSPSQAIVATTPPTSLGTTPNATVTAGPGQTLGSVQIVINRGSKTASAAKRKPQFVSPSAYSVGITVNGGTPTYADVSANSYLCSTSGSVETCSLPIAAPAGSVTIGLTFYDAANGTGNLLGQGTGTTTVTLGTPWTITIPIAAYPGSVSVSAQTQTILAPAALSQQATLYVNDPDGNPITGALAATVPITVYDPAHQFTISPTSITSSPQTLTISYAGGAFTHAIVTIGSNTGAAGVAFSFVSTSAPHHVAMSNYALGQIPVYYIGGVRTWTAASTPATTPQWVLTGVEPVGIAADASGNLYVPNRPPADTLGAASLDIYAAGASGNASPIRSLTGYSDAYGYSSPALDAAGNIYDLAFTGQIDVFAAGASGAAAPISGVGFASTCGYPADYSTAVALDRTNNLLFTLCSPSGDVPPTVLYEFPSTANGTSIAPTRSVSFPQPSGGGVGIDGNGNAIVVAYDTGPVFWYVPAGSTTAIKLGTPDVFFTAGVVDSYLTVDAAGFIYFGSNNGGLNVYAPYPSTAVNPVSGLIEPIDRIFDPTQTTAVNPNDSPNNSPALLP